MPDRFHVEPDDDGDLVLWDATDPARPRLVAWRCEHTVIGVDVSPRYGPLVWQVLTSVLAPDEATVERLAEQMVASDVYAEDWRSSTDEVRGDYRRNVRAVLAALRAPADQGGAS